MSALLKALSAGTSSLGIFQPPPAPRVMLASVDTPISPSLAPRPPARAFFWPICHGCWTKIPLGSAI